jgi:hypothetical protein
VAYARAEWLVSGLGLDLGVITSPSPAFRLASQNVGLASHSASLPSAKWLALIAQCLGPYGQTLCARYITIHHFFLRQQSGLHKPFCLMPSKWACARLVTKSQGIHVIMRSIPSQMYLIYLLLACRNEILVN